MIPGEGPSRRLFCDLNFARFVSRLSCSNIARWQLDHVLGSAVWSPDHLLPSCSLRRHNEIMGNIRLMDADMQLEDFGIMWKGPVTQLGNALEPRKCDSTAHHWRGSSLISSCNCSTVTLSRLITASQVGSPGGDNIQNLIPPLCPRVFRRAGH